jgi:hypothetical protein
MIGEIDVERAEAQLDALIERRVLEAEASEREAQEWAESPERYDLRLAAQIRREWWDYHRHRVVFFEDFAQRHREKLWRLIDGAM